MANRNFFIVRLIILALLALYSNLVFPANVGPLQGLIIPQGISIPANINPNSLSTNLNSNINKTPQNQPSAPSQSTNQNNTNLPQLTPNAFQVFVQQTTGQFLPIYGQDLFNSGNAFTPADQVPVSNSYIIGPGDELLITIYSNVINMNDNVVVSREGTINLPKIGPVEVAGMEYKNIEPYLKKRLQEAISDFSLNVTMGNLHGIDIYIVGQARKPGKVTISSVSTLINAILTTGGPNSNGSMRQIELVRNGQVIEKVDIYQFLNTGKIDTDFHLLQGDTINYPRMGSEVALMGLVPTPAVYELSENESPTLQNIIQIAGGVSSLTSPLKASLESINAGKDKPLTIKTLTLNRDGMNTILKDGDILTLFPIKPAFDNAVTLNIPDSTPLRLPIQKGWRISNIIPNRDSLLTSGYYLRRFNMAGETPGITSSTNEVGTGKINSINSNQSVAGQTGQGSNSTDTINNNATSRDKKQFSLSSSSGSQTNQISNNPDQQNFNTSLNRIRLNNKLQINWTQAIIERTRKEDQKQIILSFDLEKAIAGDPTNNLLIEPGDIITIFSQKDVQVPQIAQTRVVQLQGEVLSPGIYQLRPGETLQQLIMRAGGLTGNAYIYGTELDRVSVKQLQQKNIESVIGQLEDQITRQATTVNASSASVAAVQQTVNAQAVPAIQAKINKLRAINPNGRVALDIEPNSDVLPEVKLEDGDVINIPQKPSNVAVIGAVYNENALIYQDNKDASFYINKAGLSESANQDKIFIARANGIIVAPHKSGWFSSGSVLDTTLMPGDTVVVPDKIYTEQGTFFRELTDYTQLFSNLGITAATLKFLGII